MKQLPRRVSAATMISIGLAVACPGLALADIHDVTNNVYSLVPEAQDYEVCYGLEIPDEGGLGTTGTASYAIDNSALYTNPCSFGRVAYYVELQTTTNDPLQWVWVSMDAFTENPMHLGVPSRGVGAAFQQNVKSANVFSSGSVHAGTNLATCNIEFWGWNYNAANGVLVPNASADVYDFGDDIKPTANYGSMQFHNHDIDGAGPGTTGEVLFAYNRWGNTGDSDLGIGNGTGTQPDWTFEQNADTYEVKNLLVLVRPTGGPDITFTERPTNLRVYPRNLVSDEADVTVAGTVHTPGYDEVIVQVFSNGVLRTPVTSQTLSYSGSDAGFGLTNTIMAGLLDYDVEVLVRAGATTTLVCKADDVAAGDVFLVNGQSNAEAREFSGSANASRGPFLRSFGINSSNPSTVENDLQWYQAEGDSPLNVRPGNVGQWALRMGRRIVDTYGVPVAILNGAHGGRPITWFQRDDGVPDNTATNYGRLLFRAQAAGVADAVRAILWYQGETDNGDGATHEAGFMALYDDWKVDYPNTERFYVHQLHVGCGVSKWDVDLRNRQRLLADTYADLEVMSTTGLNGHDGCHYNYTDGYETMGDHIFDLVARDLYGSSNTNNVEAPNIDRAYFSRADKTEVTLEMRNANDTPTFDPGAEADFRLEGSAVTVTGGSIASNTIVLSLSGNGGAATSVTYAGHQGPGPWVTNANGVGLLAFTDVPVETVALPEPGIQNEAATNIQHISASLNGTLTSTGQSATAVTVYWGPTDGESDPFGWDNPELLGTNVQEGPVSFAAIGLDPATTYHYRFYATNAHGESWAATSTSFTTLAGTPEVSNDGGASNVTFTSAVLNGELVSTGTAATTVFVYWGTEPGGTDTSVWDHVERIGTNVQEVLVTTNVTGLSSDTEYFYRFYATNAFGETWAPDSASFMTLSDFADYPLKMPITFTGYDKGALTNFPALVILNESLPGFQYDQLVSGQGADLRFSADDQVTTLLYEIEEWNPAGDSYVWVQVPVLSNGAVICAYWGNTNLLQDTDPLSVPGLQLWLKADAGVQTNGTGGVTNWVDQSGQGRDASSSAAANGPTITPAVLNGLPVLSFDSLDDVLSYDGTFLANTDYTVFIIEGRASVGGNWFMGGADGAQQNLHAGYRNNTTVSTAHWNNDLNVGVAGFTGQVFHVWAFHLDSTGGNGRTLLIDGTPIGTKADNTQLLSYNGAALGGLPASGAFFTGDLAEVIVYNRNLTEAEKNQIGLFLADKYGLDVAYDSVQPPAYTMDGSTWDSDFVGVWHIEEDVADEATTGVHEDSTANENDGSQNGNDDTPAVVSDGQAFDGDDYVNLGDVMPAGAYTKLAWVKRTASGARNIISGNANHAFWAPPTLGSQLSAGHNGSYHYVQDPVVLTQDEWFQVAVSFDPAVNSGEMVLYKNGVEVDRATGVPTQDDSTTTYISRFGTGHYWVGDIDEVRMSSVARGSNWVCAVYANVASNAAFMTYGQVQGLDTPIVSNDGGASNVLYTSAVLNGDLVSTGAAAAEVFVYWGASDGGTDPLSWDESGYFGFRDQGTLLSTNVTGLADDTMYYYRFFASNTLGGAWAGTPESFMTPRGRPTITNNGGASNVTDTAADLVGDLVSTGAAATEVTVFWGTSDGGTDPFGWDTPANLGTKEEGLVIAPVAGLADNTMYYYRYYATNDIGEAWADSTETFQTLLALTPTQEKLKITFSGYSPDEALTNFPALVVLNEGLSNFSYRNFFSREGDDLRFFDASETVELNYEIEEWNVNGDSFVWVQVPLLTNGACIYAKWGDPAATNVPAYTTDGSTWESNFKGVWHMTETDAQDSTAGANHGTGVDNTDAAGIISGGQDFNGSTAIIDLSAHAADVGFVSPATISFWMRPLRDALSGGYNAPWTISNFDIGLDGLTGGLANEQIDIVQAGNLMAYTSTTKLWDALNPSWRHVTVVLDGVQSRLFYDGQELPLTTRGGDTDSGAYASGTPTIARMGRSYLGDFKYEGRLDEVRVTCIDRGSNWVWATYANVASNDTFAAYGEAMGDGGGPADEDGDGIPDDWELANCGSTTGCTATAQTDDGDIYTYGEEYVLDFDPAVSNATFSISEVGLGSFDVTFGETTNSRVYTVDFSTNLNDGTTWVVVEGAVSGSNGVTTVTDPGAADHREYRIRVHVP